MTLLNHSAGFKYVKDLMPSMGFRVVTTNPQNKGRHELVQVEDKKGFYGYFYLVFKHAFFHSFNNVAEDFIAKYPDFEGQGESINIEFLELARRFNAALLYVYPDGRVYSVHSISVYKFVHEHGLIRDQDRENKYVEVQSDGGL